MNVFHLMLALLMLITGSINTLSVKWADKMTSENTAGKKVNFNHPFLQACGMFLGEMLCMVAYYIVKAYKKRRNRHNIEALSEEEEGQERPKFNPFIFFPPALCDMTATSIQYIALTLTYASSFQMLRGAVIIFTGLLSRLALGRKLQPYRWLGIFFVICGLCIVGACDILYKDSDSNNNGTSTTHLPMRNNDLFGVSNPLTNSNHSSNDQLIGDVMIVCAQVIVASQMVYEEKFISKYDVHPLQAVGWEGTFGFLTMGTLLIPFYFIPVSGEFGKHNPRGVLEDAYDGLYQLAHNPYLAFAFCGTVISIAFFNFAGISVTKEMSATTRMVLDSVRTLVIWTVSLLPFVKWQEFHALQLVGFIVLVTGMCIYNNIIFAPLVRKLIATYRSRYNRLEENVDNEETNGIVEEPQHVET